MPLPTAFHLPKTKKILIILACCLLLVQISFAQELYKVPPAGTTTHWVSAENPSGEKGQGGKINKGAKGSAFYIIPAGQKQVLMDVKGAGIIQRIWLSGTIPVDNEQRRSVRIDMYWDGAKKPAVSAPIGDFFGMGLGYIGAFENDLFASPEARSFNCFAKMPYKKSAYITITNESSKTALVWYDINYLALDQPDNDALYFHAYWNRALKTTLGKDYEILPKVEGKGRFIGTNIGVITDSAYGDIWFGEGEVKMYLDGDNKFPSLVGTGTEDYIGSGWGQGVFNTRYSGSILADIPNGLWAFYRYHIADAVYFNSDCKVTIQQMGSTSREKLREMAAAKIPSQPVWVLYDNDKPVPKQAELLDMKRKPDLDSDNFPVGSTNFYRSDDVSATAYFYLDKPETDLPKLPPLSLRMQDLQQKVFDKVNKK